MRGRSFGRRLLGVVATLLTFNGRAKAAQPDATVQMGAGFAPANPLGRRLNNPKYPIRHQGTRERLRRMRQIAAGALCFVLLAVALGAQGPVQTAPANQPFTVEWNHADSPATVTYTLEIDGSSAHIWTPAEITTQGPNIYRAQAPAVEAGRHTLRIRASNAFGESVSTVINFEAGAAPGSFGAVTIVTIIQSARVEIRSGGQ